MSKPKVTREQIEAFKKEFLEGIKHYRSELDRLEKEYLRKIEKIKQDAYKEAEAKGHVEEITNAEKIIDNL